MGNHPAELLGDFLIRCGPFLRSGDLIGLPISSYSIPGAYSSAG